MHVHQIDKIEGYVSYLNESEHEIDILFKELLIGVTNFFRDPDSFKLLQEKIIPEIMDKAPEGQPLRAWIPGCSTGEEAYSIAILIHECMEKVGKHFDVQIFGTDIDDTSVDVARGGVYPVNISVDVNQNRLKRYFTKEKETYRVKKVIREMIVFAPQNVIKDPPFTKLNLLCCRNLLIYMDSPLQKKVMPIFHYSLKDDGVLFLGSSESIGQFSDIFSPLSKKWRVYKRKPTTDTPILMDFSAATYDYQSNAPKNIKKIEELSAFQLVETILEQSDMPPCVIVNSAGDILYIHGKTGRFLEPAEGKISNNISKMVKPGLKTELITSLRNVSRLNKEIVSTGIEVQSDGVSIYVDMTVKPILEHTALKGMIMVIFQEMTSENKGKKMRPFR